MQQLVCAWCGEPHAVDRLCQSAQRGLTRRSFCFLFGAGIAGLAGAKFLPSGPYSVPFDASLELVYAAQYPDRLSFTTQKRFTPGEVIVFDWNGDQLFGGHITKVVTQPDGFQRITAESRQPPPSLPNGV